MFDVDWQLCLYERLMGQPSALQMWCFFHFYRYSLVLQFGCVLWFTCSKQNHVAAQTASDENDCITGNSAGRLRFCSLIRFKIGPSRYRRQYKRSRVGFSISPQVSNLFSTSLLFRMFKIQSWVVFKTEHLSGHFSPFAARTRVAWNKQLCVDDPARKLSASVFLLPQKSVVHLFGWRFGFFAVVQRKSETWRAVAIYNGFTIGILLFVHLRGFQQPIRVINAVPNEPKYAQAWHEWCDWAMTAWQTGISVELDGHSNQVMADGRAETCPDPEKKTIFKR